MKNNDLKEKKYERIGRYKRPVIINYNSYPVFSLIVEKPGKPDAEEAWAREDLIGLMGVNKCTFYIWKLSKQNHPYADSILISIESRLKYIDKTLIDKTKLLNTRLKDLTAGLDMQIVTTKSDKPKSWEYDFGPNPYSNYLLTIISRFDLFFTLSDTCYIHRCISADECDELRKIISTLIRRFFEYVQNNTKQLIDHSISRDEMAEKNITMISELGDLNENIMNKKNRPQFINEFGDIKADDIDLIAAMYSINTSME